MKNLKNMILILVAILITITLTGCGKTEPSAEVIKEQLIAAISESELSGLCEVTDVTVKNGQWVSETEYAAVFDYSVKMTYGWEELVNDAEQTLIDDPMSSFGIVALLAIVEEAFGNTFKAGEIQTTEHTFNLKKDSQDNWKLVKI